MRVAAVDLGTNSTRLLVADVDDGRVEEVARHSQITRLGEGVDERRKLLPSPVARVRNVLSEYRREAERLGAERVLTIGTSAVRDAENGEALLGEIEWSYGFATRLLSGEEEAAMTVRGVGSGGEPSPDMLILDIGGGSTELIVADFHTSLELGSVRHTERFLHSDPPTTAELEQCSGSVRSLLAEHVPDDVRPHVTGAIGVAGTLTTLAALDLGLATYERERVHGHRLGRNAARTQLERLASLPVYERRELPAMEPERAPVVVAGAVILAETLDYFDLDEITVSERDILDGAAFAAAELPAPGEGAAPPGAYTCC